MASPDTRNSSTKGSSRSALIIVGVLAVLGLAYALIRVDVLRARIVEVRLQLEKTDASQTALLNRVTALTEINQSSAVRLAQLQTELKTLGDSVTELRGGAALAQRQSARSEVLYLLRLANDQLQLGRDLRSARSSLRAADNVLRAMNEAGNGVASDPVNITIHQQVGRALQQLQALPDEVTPIEAQLQRAEQQVPQLKLAGILLADTPPAASLPEAGFSRAWLVFKQGVSQLISIDQTSSNANALLDTDQQQLRRRHLQLLILDARLAVHLRDQRGYVTALQAAEAWLKQYFDASDTGVSALTTQVLELAQQNIAPVLPDLSTSIQTLAQQLPDSLPASERR